MVTTLNYTTAAPQAERTSFVVPPMHLTTVGVSAAAWRTGVNPMSNAAYGNDFATSGAAKATNVFAAMITADRKVDPRSLEAKQAAPPRGIR